MMAVMCEATPLSIHTPVPFAFGNARTLVSRKAVLFLAMCHSCKSLADWFGTLRNNGEQRLYGPLGHRHLPKFVQSPSPFVCVPSPGYIRAPGIPVSRVYMEAGIPSTPACQGPRYYSGPVYTRDPECPGAPVYPDPKSVPTWS